MYQRTVGTSQREERATLSSSSSSLPPLINIYSSKSQNLLLILITKLLASFLLRLTLHSLLHKKKLSRGFGKTRLIKKRVCRFQVKKQKKRVIVFFDFVCNLQEKKAIKRDCKRELVLERERDRERDAWLLLTEKRFADTFLLSYL